MALLKSVLIRFIVEKLRSLVAVVTGKVQKTFKYGQGSLKQELLEIDDHEYLQQHVNRWK